MSTKVKRSKLRVRIDRQKTVLTILPMTKIFIFSILPLIGIVLAFQEYYPALGFFSPWVGFYNFRYVFESGMVVRLMTNAIVLNLLFITLTTTINILLALFLFEIRNRYLLKGFQSIFFLPYFVSWPLVGMLAGGFLGVNEGLITNLIYNLTGKTIRFYEEPGYWRVILTFVMIWKNCGAGCIFNYAFLLGTDQGIYEAASIDGAGVFQRMFLISLPNLYLMIFISLITSLGSIIRMDMSLIWFVVGLNPLLYPTTDVFESFQMRALINQAKVGQPVALGLFQGVVGLVLSAGANYTIKRIDKDASLF